MCWGMECGDGWYRPIRKLSYALEALNIEFYSEYGLRIQADQVKEKFGTLHFYYDVVADPPAHKQWLSSFLEAAHEKLARSCSFEMKKVVDRPSRTYDETKVLTLDEYEKELKGIKCSNVEYKIEGNQILRISHLTDYGKSHFEPTKHVFRYKLSETLRKLSYKFDARSSLKLTSKQKIFREVLHDAAEQLVRRAEAECMNVCEVCGHQIGTEWSPVCTTTGWVQYICEDCAQSRNAGYYCNGNLMKGTEVLKTKEQLEAEQKERTAKYEAERKQQDEEARLKVEEAKKEIEKK